MVLNNQLSILTGGPGTGKTTTIKEIIKQAKSRGLIIELCAPTGKAAKRMMEATGGFACTIHKLMEPQVGDNGIFYFTKNEINQIKTGLVIVDEVSMVTNNLMADFLKAINIKTKILLVGDKGQLPSVGPGAVLRDLLKTGIIPTINLTKIHRSAGDIAFACQKIEHGKVYKPSDSLDLDAIPPKNLRHIEVSTPEAIQSVIKKLVSENLSGRGYDPTWDVQIISPMNSRTNLSCQDLNFEMQKILNHDAKKMNGTSFCIADKVINTKNKIMPAVHNKDELIVNGDIGYIIMDPKAESKEHYFIKSRTLCVNFINPDRQVYVERRANSLLHAYAITCHRMQGSEAPVIVIPVHNTFGPFVNRSWIYTAISRAKEICITVGRFKAIESAIHRIDSQKRKTLLTEKIMSMYKEDSFLELQLQCI